MSLSKIITKIEFEGKIIGSKPLSSDDTLSSVRTKLKEKTKNISYQFLDAEGNNVEVGDENDYKLSDIINDKKIKIVAAEIGESIKIFINNKEFCSKNINEMQNLQEVRNCLNNEIKQDFIFLDIDSCDIEKEDEENYPLKDILNNQAIYLKCNRISDDQEPGPKLKPTPEETHNTTPDSTPKKKKKFDLSKYKEIKNKEFDKDNLKLYRYSKVKADNSKNERVYEYFYDEFDDVNDFKDAYIVLFCGKTGDGKSTAINAFFNIVKGVTLEDTFRFILINEPEKEEGQSVSQTTGVHLYYIKDYNNKPIIIVDSQGYGDTRGPKEDEKISKAFCYVFTEIIDHINAACFVSKATNNRLDTLTKYIFSSVTSLFSEDISENFIILATFANSETIKKGPAFITSINHDADFLNINKRMDKKNYWFAFDSKCLFDDDFNSKLTKYSYDQLCKLYEEKIKKLFPKGTKESGKIVSNRENLKTEVNNLNSTFKNLLVEQDNLKEKERVINEGNLKIWNLEKKINDIEDKKKTLKPEELEKEIKKVNEECNKTLNELSNKKRKEKKKELAADSNNKYTRCDECKENCHNPCDCWFSFTSRCKIYPVFSEKCERCGHSKKVHKQDYYHYIYVEEEVSEDTSNQKKDAINNSEKEKAKLQERIKQQNSEKNSLQREINELNYAKEDLLEKKNKYEREKNQIEAQVENINKKIKIIILKLKRLSDEILIKGMNKNHMKNENEYIDSLSSQMHEIGYKENEIKEKLGDIKKNNDLLKSAIKINQEDLLEKSADELMNKCNIKN